MLKHVIAAAAAVTALWAPEAAGHSLLQRKDWQGATFQRHLPDPVTSIPWLNLGTQAKQPKEDPPIWREPLSIEQALVPADSSVARAPSSTLLRLRSM